MGSSKTGLDLEDTSRTIFCGLGLGLEHSWPWLWPRRPLALASTVRGLGFGFEEICEFDLEKVLSIPATSAPVERVLSQSGLIMRPNRARLGKKLLCQLVFLTVDL